MGHVDTYDGRTSGNLYRFGYILKIIPRQEILIFVENRLFLIDFFLQPI